MTSAYCACHGDIQGPPQDPCIGTSSLVIQVEGPNLNKGVLSHGQGNVFQIKTQNALRSRRSRKDKYSGQSGCEGTWKARGHGYDLRDSEKSMAPAGLSQTSSSSQKLAEAINSLLAIKIWITIIDQKRVALRPCLCWEDTVLSMFPLFTETEQRQLSKSWVWWYTLVLPVPEACQGSKTVLNYKLHYRSTWAIA